MTVATSGTRPKVLFFAPILEYPPAGGPQISVVNAVKVLHQISELHIVTTVPIDRREAEETVRFFKAHSHALVQAPSYKLTVQGKFVGKFVRLFRRLAAPLLAKIDGHYVLRYANAHGIDVFWVDRVLEYAFAVFAELRRLHPAGKIVGDTCSVFSRFVLRELPLVSNPLRRLWIRAMGRKKQREERMLTALADVVTAVSELDAQYFRSIAPHPERVKLFSNVVDLGDYGSCDHQAAQLSCPSLLLLGSFGHQNSPMDRAAKWMATEVMPLVLRDVPDAQLYIIGRNADRTQANLRSDAIKVIGRVPSVVPYLYQAAATLVPLRFESGTRFKILESGAASIPCVSTALGAEGIAVTDKENILIAETEQEFAAAIVGVLRDPVYARTLGTRLHDLVAERYSLETQKREGQAIIRFLEERRVAATS